KLVSENVLTMADADAMVEQYRRELDEGKSQAKQSLGMIGNKHTVDWTKFQEIDWTETVPTGLKIGELRELAKPLTSFPSNCTLHRQVAKIVQDREKMAAGQLPLDWGFAETLAYASLLTQGFEVRISGQDSGRGTFFHRHAVWHDQTTGQSYIPLKNLSPSQPRFTVIDS